MIHTHAVREKSEEKRVAVAKHKCRFLELNVCVTRSTERKKNNTEIILEKKKVTDLK